MQGFMGIYYLNLGKYGATIDSVKESPHCLRVANSATILILFSLFLYCVCTKMPGSHPASAAEPKPGFNFMLYSCQL